MFRIKYIPPSIVDQYICVHLVFHLFYTSKYFWVKKEFIKVNNPVLQHFNDVTNQICYVQPLYTANIHFSIWFIELRFNECCHSWFFFKDIQDLQIRYCSLVYFKWLSEPQKSNFLVYGPISTNKFLSTGNSLGI